MVGTMEHSYVGKSCSVRSIIAATANEKGIIEGFFYEGMLIVTVCNLFAGPLELSSATYIDVKYPMPSVGGFEAVGRYRLRDC